MRKMFVAGIISTAMLVFDGFCLTPTSSLVPLPAEADRGKFINYQITNDSKIIIKYKDQANEFQTFSLNIENSKKTEYIIAKLMHARSGQSPVSRKGEMVIAYKNASNEIIGVGFESQLAIKASSLFRLALFKDNSGNDIFYITITNSNSNFEEHSFNIFDNSNAFDLDYVVGQLIVYPLGEEIIPTDPRLKVNKTGTPPVFQSIEFEWNFEPPVD